MFLGTLIKQPNDKYCVINRSSEVVHYNLSEQDIIDQYIEDAKARVEAAEPFSKLIEATVRSGYIEHTNDIPDNWMLLTLERILHNDGNFSCG